MAKSVEDEGARSRKRLLYRAAKSAAGGLRPAVLRLVSRGDSVTYRQLFETATDGLAPFPYQEALAHGPALPWVVSVPTGIGKTAAVVLGWVWRRRYHPDASVRSHTPRPPRLLPSHTRSCRADGTVGLQLAGKGGPARRRRPTNPTPFAFTS